MSAREWEALTCCELIDLLANYLDSALSQAAVVELEDHLAKCAECQAYLNTYRSARTLAARAGSVEMPAEMRRRLSEFLVRHLSPGGA
jgi:anti-sigma factor RsiW